MTPKFGGQLLFRLEFLVVKNPRSRNFTDCTREHSRKTEKLIREDKPNLRTIVDLKLKFLKIL